MSKAGFFQYLMLTRFGQPAHERSLYRTICDLRSRRVVEIGLEDGRRARNMIALALRTSSEKALRYTGIDLFEARSTDASFSLKRAHQLLQSSNYEVRLVPGDPASALARCANELRGTDLVVIAATQDSRSIAAAWHFLPRMLHKDSRVCVEQQDNRFEILTPAQVRAYSPQGKASKAA